MDRGYICRLQWLLAAMRIYIAKTMLENLGFFSKSGLHITCIIKGWYQADTSVFHVNLFPSLYTLLGSGSEWPKDEALFLTMVSYLK